MTYRVIRFPRRSTSPPPPQTLREGTTLSERTRTPTTFSVVHVPVEQFCFLCKKINKVFCTHSRVARRLCGGAFTAFVSVSAKDFVVEEGDQFLKPFYVSDGDFTKTFCAKCGTTVVHLFPSTKEAWIPISNLNDPGNDLFPISHFELEEGVDYFPVLSMS
eukprot:PhF_6_TR35380/c0_g2_i1/m.51420